MQVREFLQVMRRRWYLVIVAVIVAAGAMLGTLGWVGPTYQAQGVALLIPPAVTLRETGASTGSGNPYVALGGLIQARDVAIRSISAQATYLEICAASGDARYEAMRRELCAQDPGVSYEVTPDFNSSAPVILVTIEANTPENAVTAVGVVMNRVPLALTTLQQGLNLRPRADITSLPIVTDAVPTVVRKDQIRAGIVAGGGVLALGLLAIGFLDGRLPQRRSVSRPLVAPDWSTAPSADLVWDMPEDGAAGGSGVGSKAWGSAANSALLAENDLRSGDETEQAIERVREITGAHRD